MKVEVRLFAAARELAGKPAVEAELPDDATVADLRRWLAEAFPDLEPLLRSAAFALDAEYAVDDAPLSDGAEIACIPPVSGG